jgi:hypothetical protein
MFMTAYLGFVMLSCGQDFLQYSTRTGRSTVYLTRAARDAIAKMDPARREALSDGFRRVGRELLSSAEQVRVEAGWARRTWPRRRYP